MMDRLRHATDVARFKADQLLRVNRVQGEISNLRREIQVVREQVASAALELHRSGSLLHAEIEQLCVAIDRLNSQITEREALVAAIQAEQPPQLAATMTYAAASPAIQATVQSSTPTRPTRACPHCDFGAPVHAAFCPNCGKALPKLPEPATSESADQPPRDDATPPDTDTPSTDTTDTTDTTKGD